MRNLGSVGVLAILAVVGCGCGDNTGAGPDAAPPDAPEETLNTNHCTYQPLQPSRVAGDVIAGPLRAGAAEVVLDIPVGTALGGFTARAGFLGNAGQIDLREIPMSGAFNPSVGIVSRPRAKALAITTDGPGGDTIIIIKVDSIFAYEGLLFDVEERLGSNFAGKVLYATSHSHSAFAQHTGHPALKLGAGDLRGKVYDRVLDGMVIAASAALGKRVPARLGVVTDAAFDANDRITRDRRDENDELMGGRRKDDRMFMIRVDSAEGVPIAAVPIYGIHGTLNDDDNPLASNDATGATERMLETYLPPNTVVMHLQSAGGDVAPTPHGGVDCSVKPGRPSDPCFSWTTEEGHATVAAETLHAAWVRAAGQLQNSLALEMVTESVELGPHRDTFSIRGGALRYAPFDPAHTPDGMIFDGSGNLISPIDEFNAPVGAALCEKAMPTFPVAAIEGTEGIVPYGSCQRLDAASEILQTVFGFTFEATPTRPLCQTTRTTLSALRLGDYVIGTLPGEVTVLIADKVRATSPVPPERTIVVGYAQGHVGYLLAPEDWALGGYESSITFWGPLEAEYLVERLAALLPVTQTPAREDGASLGRDRVASPRVTDNFPIDNPAPMAGTVSATPPDFIWLRSGTPASGQPAATVSRVSGIATFVWNGDDPLVKTPEVRVEREAPAGTWTPIARPGGRVIEDGEMALAYTPQPLKRVEGVPQVHTWAVEFQAVAPWGSSRTGVRPASLPLGRYRFHVQGQGWELRSQPFSVVEGGVEATLTRESATAVRVAATMHAPRGWRLLDPQSPSNRPVPLRTQPVTVEFRDAGGGLLASVSGQTDAAGVIVADGGGAAAGAATVRVFDAYGNGVSQAAP